MLGEDCLVQMFTEGIDGGRHFFKCLQAWVLTISIYFFNMFLVYITYMTYLLQSFFAEEDCGFTSQVDPRPIYPHAKYIYYLQDRIFDLEREVSSDYKDDGQDDNNNGADSQEALYNDPYCTYPNHNNKGLPHHLRHHHHQQ